jgi:hypothetical protein
MQGGVALTAGAIGPTGFVGIYQYSSSGTYWELLNPVASVPVVIGSSIYMSNNFGGF